MQTEQFNLQLEVNKYLNRLHAKTTITVNDEKELESHIYDGIDSLEKKGLTTEEAFLITIKRMGNLDLLSDEYNKVNPFFVSGKIRSYSITGMGLMLSFGTVFLLAYELISLCRKSFLTNTTADEILKILLYFALCMAVLITFKWGRSFSVLLQKNIERRPLMTTAILFLLPLLSLLSQFALTNLFDKSGQTDGSSHAFYNSGNVQYIHLSYYLLIIAVLFTTLVLFGSAMKKGKLPAKSLSLRSPVAFLVVFSLMIYLAAMLARYIPQNNSDLQSAVFIAVIYTTGSFSIAFYDNKNLWAKLVIFSFVGLCLGNLLII